MSKHKPNPNYKSRFATATLPPISDRREEAALIKMAQAGNQDAMDHLIISNMRFVIRTAAHYNQASELEFDDLVVEGIIGLRKGILKHNNPEIKLISYAVWWIRQHISAACLEYNSVSVNRGFMGTERTKHKKRLQHPIWQRYAKGNLASMPVDDLLSDDLEAAIGSAPPCIMEYELDRPYEDDINEALPEELWTMQEDDGEKAYSEFLPLMKNFVDEIPEKEREALIRYYGLFGTHPMTLSDLGIHMKVSKERVRQLKNKAVVRLTSKLKLLQIKQ